MSQPGMIRIGIGGWVYPPWRGTFYPPGLPQELAYGPCQGNALVLVRKKSGPDGTVKLTESGWPSVSRFAEREAAD
jgi:hypothetical protein